MATSSKTYKRLIFFFFFVFELLCLGLIIIYFYKCFNFLVVWENKWVLEGSGEGRRRMIGLGGGGEKDEDN